MCSYEEFLEYFHSFDLYIALDLVFGILISFYLFWSSRDLISGIAFVHCLYTNDFQISLPLYPCVRF